MQSIGFFCCRACPTYQANLFSAHTAHICINYYNRWIHITVIDSLGLFQTHMAALQRSFPKLRLSLNKTWKKRMIKIKTSSRVPSTLSWGYLTSSSYWSSLVSQSQGKRGKMKQVFFAYWNKLLPWFLRGQAQQQAQLSDSKADGHSPMYELIVYTHTEHKIRYVSITTDNNYN